MVDLIKEAAGIHFSTFKKEEKVEETVPVEDFPEANEDKAESPLPHIAAQWLKGANK